MDKCLTFFQRKKTSCLIIILWLKEFWVLPMLVKWNSDLVVTTEKIHLIWMVMVFWNWLFFFFFGGGGGGGSGANLPADFPVYPSIWYGDCKFQYCGLEHTAEFSKFTLTVGNCEVVIALVILVFYYFFPANYYQNRGKYFVIKWFNQIKIMNFTKSIAFLTNI